MTLPDILSGGEEARLFPIVAETSKEKRIASVFLALLPNIPDLASDLLKTSKVRVGSRSKITCYTEVVLKNDAEKKDRPDGLIIVENGKSKWMALVEFKIGKADLEQDQVERYLRLAKDNDIDAVITISNQFVARADHPPVTVSKVLLRKTKLFHWSWMYIYTRSQLLQLDDAIDDIEQKFLLDEFVRFLDHPSTGVSGFTQMNKGWRGLVSTAGAGGALSKTSLDVENTVAGWIEEQRDICLLLTRLVGKTVQQKISRKLIDDPNLRLKEEIAEFCKTKDLTAIFQVPDAAADIIVEADLVRKSVDVSMRLKAPEDKKTTKARVNWLLRMLKDDDERIIIRAHWPSRLEHTQVRLIELREDPDRIQSSNPKVAPNSFEVLLVTNLANRFGGSRTFIEDLETAVPDFYSLIGQNLKEWQPPAPKPVVRVLNSAERVSDIQDE